MKLFLSGKTPKPVPSSSVTTAAEPDEQAAVNKYVTL